MAAQLPLGRYFPELQKSYEGETRYLEILERIIFPRGRGFMQRWHVVVRPILGRSAASSRDCCPRRPRSTKDFECSVGFAGRADRALSRSTSGHNTGRVHLPTGDHSDAAVVKSEQELERQGARGRRRKTKLGPERAIIGCDARSPRTPRRQHFMDDRFGERVPGATIRRHGCRPAHARQGGEQGNVKN
jgi:hypothetical protein